MNENKCGKAYSSLSARCLVFGLVDDETDALDLADVVEANDADEGFGVGLGALLDLGCHLAGVCAPEHWQLPHHPVSPVVVSGAPVVRSRHVSVLIELKAGHPSIVQQIVDLLQQPLR
eukprot:Gb_00391 [translate_table: standard]